MNILKISEHYYLRSKNGIYAMSQVDCEIINEVMASLELRDPELYHAISQYKSKRDVDVLNDLKVISDKRQDFDEEGFKDMSDVEREYWRLTLEEKKVRILKMEQSSNFNYGKLVIGDQDIPVLAIRTITRGTTYDPDDECKYWLITINKGYQNRTMKFEVYDLDVKFKTEELRDNEYVRVKDILYKSSGIKFIG